MVSFFAKYPVIDYGLPGSPSIKCRDIMQRAKIRDFLINNFLIFYKYTVKDGETPELIAHKLYGSSQYHTIVLFVNQIIDPYFDWPLSSEGLIATIRTKYGTDEIDGLTYAYKTIHHYEDSFGNPIDFKTHDDLPDDQRSTVYIYDHEVAQNEARREIRLLDARFVQQVDKEMDTIMRSPVA